MIIKKIMTIFHLISSSHLTNSAELIKNRNTSRTKVLKESLAEQKYSKDDLLLQYVTNRQTMVMELGSINRVLIELFTFAFAFSCFQKQEAKIKIQEGGACAHPFFVFFQSHAGICLVLIIFP